MEHPPRRTAKVFGRTSLDTTLRLIVRILEVNCKCWLTAFRNLAFSSMEEVDKAQASTGSFCWCVLSYCDQPTLVSTQGPQQVLLRGQQAGWCVICCFASFLQKPRCAPPLLNLAPFNFSLRFQFSIWDAFR